MYFLAYHSPAKNVIAILCANPILLVFHQYDPSATFLKIRFGEFKPFFLKNSDELKCGRQMMIDYFEKDYRENCLMIIDSETETAIHYTECVTLYG